MAQPADITEGVRSSARRGDWAERTGRVGLVARGVVYVLVGVVAFRVAWGDRSEAADKGGALELLRQQTLGDAMLAAVAIGLACYALWCLVEAVLEQDDGAGADASDTAKSWAKRAGYVGRAIAYGIAFVTTVSMLRQEAGAGGGGSERTITTTILGWGTVGQLLVAAVGIGFIAAGLWNAYRAVTRSFEKHLAVDAGPSTRRAVRAVGVAGLLGRAAAFAAIGWFVVDVARSADATQPIGLDESLATLATGPLGPVGLSVVAIGLALFGLFSFAEARWKRLFT